MLLLLALATALSANDFSVDPSTLQMNDLATVTVSLEGDFARVDGIHLPLENLAIVGQPWVSSEFAWINGEVIRRKVFRYRVRPLAPGPAGVGPIDVTAPEGEHATLARIAMQVLPDRLATSNDPEDLLRSLEASGRPPLFLVAEVDKKSVWQGEQLVVTWWLYNAATVESWRVVEVPKLPQFWSEEIDTRGAEAERAFVGNRVMMRSPMRRVALYPLQSGPLRVGGITVEASVMERIRRGPISIFEGNLVETSYTSAPIAIEVRPLPPGPPVSAVGEVSLSCDLPVQKNNGPVVVTATMNGAANLRAAAAPRLAGSVAGNVQTEGGATTVHREEGVLSMSRRWRYLIFPAKGGMLEVPPLEVTVFSPALGARRVLRCEAATLWNVTVTPPKVPRGAPVSPETVHTKRPLWWLFALGALAVFALFAVPRLVREQAIRHDARELARGTPAEIRERVEARLAVPGATLMLEASDRGDAYRALRSLLDAVERDRDIATDSHREVVRRVRELLQIAS